MSEKRDVVTTVLENCLNKITQNMENTVKVLNEKSGLGVDFIESIYHYFMTRTAIFNNRIKPFIKINEELVEKIDDILWNLNVSSDFRLFIVLLKRGNKEKPGLLFWPGFITASRFTNEMDLVKRNKIWMKIIDCDFFDYLIAVMISPSFNEPPTLVEKRFDYCYVGGSVMMDNLVFQLQRMIAISLTNPFVIKHLLKGGWKYVFSTSFSRILSNKIPGSLKEASALIQIYCWKFFPIKSLIMYQEKFLKRLVEHVSVKSLKDNCFVTCCIVYCCFEFAKKDYCDLLFVDLPLKLLEIIEKTVFENLNVLDYLLSMIKSLLIQDELQKGRFLEKFIKKIKPRELFFMNCMFCTNFTFLFPTYVYELCGILVKFNEIHNINPRVSELIGFIDKKGILECHDPRNIPEFSTTIAKNFYESVSISVERNTKCKSIIYSKNPILNGRLAFGNSKFDKVIAHSVKKSI